MAQLTEKDYRALCEALQKWCAERPGERDEQFQWPFACQFCAEPYEWVEKHDPEGYIVAFVTNDIPDDLTVAFYMRALADGSGEFTVVCAPVSV